MFYIQFPTVSNTNFEFLFLLFSFDRFTPTYLFHLAYLLVPILFISIIHFSSDISFRLSYAFEVNRYILQKLLFIINYQ